MGPREFGEDASERTAFCTIHPYSLSLHHHRYLPFGLSLSPRVFTKVVEGALTPLREVGVRILNYRLAYPRPIQRADERLQGLGAPAPQPVGLRVNWEKSKLSPMQRISFLGVKLDSVYMTARLTEERAQAVLNCLSSFRGRNVVPLKQFQRPPLVPSWDQVGPLDSGGRRLGVPVARRAVPPGGEGSLHQECCLLPCVGARRLFGRHLQSCGLGDTEHLRKILQSPRLSSFCPCVG